MSPFKIFGQALNLGTMGKRRVRLLGGIVLKSFSKCLFLAPRFALKLVPDGPDRGAGAMASFRLILITTFTEVSYIRSYSC